MEKDTYIGIGVLVIVLAVIIGYSALQPLPAKAPGTAATTNTVPAGSYVEHGQYYDVAATFATTTPLLASAGAPADAAAITTMQKFVSDTVAQFKTDGNFANLTPADIKAMGFDQGRKETLQIAYLTAAGAHTISYVFDTYADTLGAHGNTFFHTFTFDAKTGALLSLADVFSPNTPYLNTLSSIARAKLPAIIGQGLDKTMLANGTTPDAKNFQNFLFDGSTFVILFDPYAVAPYAAGPQTLRISLTDLAKILKTDYQ